MNPNIDMQRELNAEEARMLTGDRIQAEDVSLYLQSIKEQADEGFKQAIFDGEPSYQKKAKLESLGYVVIVWTAQAGKIKTKVQW